MWQVADTQQGYQTQQGSMICYGKCGLKCYPNWWCLNLWLIGHKHTRFTYRLSWLCLKWKLTQQLRQTDACLHIGLKGTVLNMQPTVIKGMIHPTICFLCWTQNKIFWWIWVTKHCWSTLTLIERKIWKSLRISNCLDFLVPQNSIYVQ